MATRNKLNFWLTVNRSCNLRCRWCYAMMTKFARNDMTMETVAMSIALAKDLGLESVILLGGEPTIHPHFLGIVRSIASASLKVYLVTNAVEFSRVDTLDRAVEAGVSAVTISLKAFNRADYKKLTRRDAFDRVERAIANIVAREISHVINVTLSQETMGKIDQLIFLARSLGVKSVSLDTGKPIIIQGRTMADGMGSPQELANFFVSAYPKFVASGMSFSFKIALPFCLFPKQFIEQILHDGNILTGCQMVTGRGVIIDPDGDIIPCNHLCHLSLGQVGGIKDCGSFDEFRASVPVSNFYQWSAKCPSARCVDCEYWPKCGGGCRLYWLHYGAGDLLPNFSAKAEEGLRHEQEKGRSGRMFEVR